MRHCLLVSLTLLALVALAPGGAACVETSFSDGEFDGADWTLVEIDSPPSFDAGTASGTLVSDGNPGNALRVELTILPAPAFSQITGVWLWGVPYDPMASGAIGSIDYAEDARFVSGGGNGHATGPALRQNDSVFIYRVGFTPEDDWTAKQATGIVASAFTRLRGAATLDFSASAAPIEVGFYRANSHPSSGGGMGTRQVDIDNWRLTLRPPCAVDGDCADTDACTTDTCVEGVCQRAPLACDDGDACTTDACTDGVCASVPISCDDANACTVDSCQAGECVNALTVEYSVVTAKAEELLARLRGSACADEPLVKKLRNKLQRKVRKARVRLARADAATRAALIGRLVGRADALLAGAERILAAAAGRGLIGDACAAELAGILAELRLCVSGLPSP